MENQDKKTSSSQNNDIDLGTLLNALGRGLRSLGRGLTRALTGLGDAIFNIIIFFKKRLIWIVLAVIAGFAYGTFVDSRTGARFYSEMTARYNFGSTRSLYNTVDYFNALVAERKLKTLQQLLSITEAEANTLSRFSVEPIEDELVISELYKKQFLFYDRSSQLRVDTFWTRVIPYDKFRASLTRYDIPMQTVTAVSTRSDIFPKVQNGFLKQVIANENLRINSEINAKMQVEEENIITSSIKGLDTLRMVYNERLRHIAQGSESPSATNINLLDKALSAKNPELELYDKILALKDELRLLRNDAMNYREIIQVVTPFTPVGRKTSLFRQSSTGLAIAAFVLVMVILVAIEGFKLIGAYEKKLKQKQSPK